jgi:hypothetical protein
VIVQVRDDGGQQVFKVMLTFTTERPGDAKNCTGGAGRRSCHDRHKPIDRLEVRAFLKVRAINFCEYATWRAAPVGWLTV